MKINKNIIGFLGCFLILLTSAAKTSLYDDWWIFINTLIIILLYLKEMKNQ